MKAYYVELRSGDRTVVNRFSESYKRTEHIKRNRRYMKPGEHMVTYERNIVRGDDGVDRPEGERYNIRKA